MNYSNINLPTISIIVPIYNVEKYIKKCIDSLINQTYDNIEIILVDDGSTDESGIICDHYARNNSRIKVIHKENRGISSSREAGINMVTGEYTMIVDGDDWIDTETVEACVKLLLEKPNLECILFSYKSEYPNRSDIKHILKKECYLKYKQVEEKVYRRLFGLLDDELVNPENQHNIESCCMKLYKTTVIKKGVFFDTSVVGSSEDGLFNMYALYGVKEAYYIDKPYYHYRKNPKSLSNAYRPDLINQWNVLFDEMQKVIYEKKLNDNYQKALNNRISLSILGIGLNELSNTGVNVFTHIHNISEYINSNRYRKAIKLFKIKKMPITWKVFLFASKFRVSYIVYLCLIVIKKIRKM